MIWKVLGIEKTKDEDAIRNAYHGKLRDVNPEDDQEGFKELRRAYEEALEYASMDEEETEEASPVSYGKNSEVDAWMGRVDKIYQDVVTRRNEESWKQVLQDKVCDDLDTELEASEALLVFFMSHSFMPQNIWRLVDQRFHYKENIQVWKEKFPENYLDYIVWQIDYPGFLDFDLFDGKTDDHVDDYINKLYELKAASEENDLPKVESLLKELERFDVTHPFTQVEKARYLLMREDSQENKEKALEIMEDLDFEYSDNPYIERVYGECLIANQKVEQAKQVYEALLEASETNVTAKIGVANCVFLLGNPEEAKEQIEDILEERVQDAECLTLLEKMNEQLVKKYEEEYAQNASEDICYKLGWCYYQQKEFAKGIALLDGVEAKEEYDYVNLRCRLYLANEEYEKAYPLTKTWLRMIEESVDDGSKEMTRRKNRLSLAYFSLGVAIWETIYKKTEGVEKKKAFDDTVSYIQKGVEEEKNVLVKLSYLEQLARFYIEAQCYEDCIRVCNDIIAQDRGFFPAYVHRQKSNAELRNAKEVIDDYFVCQELYPAYVPPYILAAEVFYAFDQYEDIEAVLQAAKDAGLDSDTLELYRIRVLHYKEFTEEHTREALEALNVLQRKILSRTEEEATDLEDMSDLVREQAILYWDLDDTKRTLEVINEYLKEQPDSMSILRLKIDVLERTGEEKEALEVCKKLYEMEPGVETRTRLGICYERVGEKDRAEELYLDAYKEDCQYSPVVRRLMYFYSFWSNREGDLEKCKLAIRYATEFIELTGSAEGYVERGNLYIDLYELEKSVEDCEKAIELDAEAFYAYNNLGCALLKLRKQEQALAPLHKAIELFPDRDHLPYLNLAECYTLMGEYEKAIELYKKVLEIWPNRVGVMEDIAKLYRKMNQHTVAVEYYRSIPNQFMKIYNDNKKDDSFYSNEIEAYCDIADTYAQAGDKKRGEKYFKKAMHLLQRYKGTRCPDKIELIVEFYRDCGEYEKAEKYMKKLFAIDQKQGYDDKHLSFTYATVLFEMGRQEEAAKHAGRFLKDLLARRGGEEHMLADRRYTQLYLYDLGIMNLCAGKLEKAKEYFTRMCDCRNCVVCESQECFEYYFGMGLVAELEGDKATAISLYKKAVEQRGHYPCAQYHLDKLLGKI